MKLSKLLIFVLLLSGIYHVSAVSIQDLIDQNKIPEPKLGVLNLSYMDIDNLEGLEKIDLRKVSVLRLRGNAITTIPSDIFKNGKNLRGVDLAENDIIEIEHNGFKGLKNLWVLVLNGNYIEGISDKNIKWVPRLKMLALYDNPISEDTLKELRKKAPVYNWPVTREFLRRTIGLTTKLAIFALATVGLIKGIKKYRQERPTLELKEILDLERDEKLMEGQLQELTEEDISSQTAKSKLILEKLSLEREISKRIESLSDEQKDKLRELREESSKTQEIL